MIEPLENPENTSIEDGQKLWDNIFNDKRFTIKDIGITQRMINHWDAEGLLINQKDLSHKRQKFTFQEVVWIRLINELREWGVPLKLIKQYRNQILASISFGDVKQISDNYADLTDTDTKKEHDEYYDQQAQKDTSYTEESLSLLDIVLTQIVFHKQTKSILFFKDGTVLNWGEEIKNIPKKEFAAYYEVVLSRMIKENHLSISLNNIIKDFVADIPATFKIQHLNLLSENDLVILNYINSGKYESITVTFKDKKAKELELKQRQDTKRRIVDIMQDGKYQDIRLKLHGGRAVVIENTIKISLQ